MENKKDIAEEVKEPKKEKNKYEEKIQEQALKIEELDDRYKRVLAEFENLKKRSVKERELLYGSLIADIFSQLLPVVDNLEKAIETNCTDDNYKQGIELLLKQFKDVFAANGVKEIESLGKTFDPELHEAVSMVQDENLGQQEIKEVFRKGYCVGNRIIRHAMVIVAN